MIRNGVSVAIVGKPNAGKSTLLNALLNENRAIVSDIAGTTRDTIEEQLNIDGILFRLIDTAGIRKHTSDVVESMGVEKSMEKIEAADLVLWILDALEEDPVALKKEWEFLHQKKQKMVSVINKMDRGEEAGLRSKWQEWENAVFISARDKKHIDQLETKLVDLVLS